MLLWKFNTANFSVSVTTADEPLESDRYMDKDCAAECRANVKSGKWKCFSVCARVVHVPTGVVLASDYLGQCIYADRKDFRDHIGIEEKSRRDCIAYGSYFSGMVRTVCREARKTLVSNRALIMKGKVNARLS